MIKVVHLATSFGRGGAELNLERLAANMDASRFSNTVISMRRGCDASMVGRLTEAGVDFGCLNMRAGVPDPTALVRLLHVVRELRPSILQTWMYHADLLGLIVGRLARVPVIIWNIRSTVLKNRGVGKLVFRSLVPLSSIPSAVVANSQAGIRVHDALGYKPKKWVWIPNSLDSSQFRPHPYARETLRQELQLDPDAEVIGLVARFDPMKDHANLIRAASMIASEHPKVRFVMIGESIDSTNAYLKSLLESYRVGERFHLLGLRNDVARLTAGFDIACSASAYGEGTSNAVTEAMACQIPCVVTDVGDSALLVGDTGRVVPPKDSQALANACRELLTIPSQRRLDLGMKARKRVEEHFSTSAIVGRYQDLYEELVQD
jgi:glycosyltransferase involved in cell wall biosynthesis